MTRIKFLATIIALIAVDQLSKYIVRHSGGFYICNPGIAFGIQIPEVLFWIVYAVIIAFVLLKLIHLKIPLCFSLLKKGENALAKFALPLNTFYMILILAGAFSNLIDRLRYGCVIDFIDLKFCPVFNLADTFITIGGIILVIKILNPKHQILNKS